MKKMNILHLISGLGYGGAEKVLLDASIQFNNNGIINSMVLPFSKDLGLLNDYIDHKIRVIPLKKDRSIKSLFEIFSFANSFVRSENIDIIHAHMFHGMLIAAMLKIYNPEIKVVFSSHSIQLGNRLRESLIFLLKPMRNVDILFSNDMKRYFHKSHNKVIQNAVNADVFKNDTNKFEKFTFVAVANLRVGKNYPFLLKCAKKLKELFNFQILIAGEGIMRGELEEAIENDKLEEHVFLLGNVKNVSRLMHQSHCLVRPSLLEGMPIAVLEAGACKLPIIATPVGSITSVLNKDNSYLTTLDDFCDKMLDVYQNYSDAQKKADKFYDQVVKEHTVEKMAKKLEDLYLSL